MRVVHCSTYDLNGGAAKSAYRLHRSLLAKHVESVMYVRNRAAIDDTVVQFRPPQNVTSRLARFIRYRRIWSESRPIRERPLQNRETFSSAMTKYGSQAVCAMPPSDIVNLHWIADFVDMTRLFGKLSVPVVWTLHDMNAYTGGCHFDQDCGRFTAACGVCPQLGSSSDNDFSRQVFRRKRRAFSGINRARMVVVGPSRWIVEQAQRSALMRGFQTLVIPYGVDTSIYRPRDTSCLRQTLEIGPNKPIVLFVADSIGSYRKGFDLLRQALSDSFEFEFTTVSVGKHNFRLHDASGDVLAVGPIENEIIMSMFYSLADLFVITSRQDNLPNTVLESLACGTPVVGFNVGGIPEMIEQEKCGRLVNLGDIQALSNAISTLLPDRERRSRMAKYCREVALERYDSGIQAQRYADLYTELLAAANIGS